MLHKPWFWFRSLSPLCYTNHGSVLNQYMFMYVLFQIITYFMLHKPWFQLDHYPFHVTQAMVPVYIITFFMLHKPWFRFISLLYSCYTSHGSGSDHYFLHVTQAMVQVQIIILTSCYTSHDCRGAGIAQSVVERQARDRKVAGSIPNRSGGIIFFSCVKFLCRLLFRYPFHPRVIAAARKRARSFCQKCRWQVTAEHTGMWLQMKCHCKLVHGCVLYTGHAPGWHCFTWHQPRVNQTALSPLRQIIKTRLVKLQPPFHTTGAQSASAFRQQMNSATSKRSI